MGKETSSISSWLVEKEISDSIHVNIHIRCNVLLIQKKRGEISSLRHWIINIEGTEPFPVSFPPPTMGKTPVVNDHNLAGLNMKCGHGRIGEESASSYVQRRFLLWEKWVMRQNRNTIKCNHYNYKCMSPSWPINQKSIQKKWNESKHSNMHWITLQTDQTTPFPLWSKVPPLACLLFKRTSTWQQIQSHQGCQCWDPSIYIYNHLCLYKYTYI